MSASVPVVIGARRVRLSSAHLEVLFGAMQNGDAGLVEICALPFTGTFASDHVVDVRGPGGALQHVRVVGPVARQTEVRLGLRDAVAVGLDTGTGCTLEGPRGTVVLSSGLRVGLRALTLTAEIARAHGIVDGAATAVVVRGERDRELRDVPVTLSTSSWLEVDSDDANALEIGPATRASLAPSSRA